MNMISTGAFLTEMDASNKQDTVAEKFAAVWEKKNAKAARAGGVSLMALSLAACGSSSTTTTTTTTDSTTDTTTDTSTDTTTTTVAGQTYTLTKSSVTGSLDGLTGTAGDDTFNAAATGFLETGDVVDGGAGTDTLNSRHSVTADTTVSINSSGVEKHYVRIDHDGGTNDTFTYSLGDISGATEVWMDRAVNSGSTKDAVFTLSGSGLTTDVAVGIKGGDAGADNSAIDFTATFTGVSGTSDSATLNLNGAAANVVTIANIETLNIVATTTETSVSATGASDINSLQAANASTVNISGAGAVSLSGAAGTFVDANLAATVTVNAADNTGGVAFKAEANTLTFTGGSGADKVYMANRLTSADTLDGGAGRDTIGLTADVTAAVGGKVSNFEIIDVVDAASITLDVDDYANSSIDTIALSGALAGNNTVTVNDIPNGGTLSLGGGEALTATDDITLSVKNAGVAGANDNSFNIAIVGTAAVDVGTIVLPNVETINIASGGAATGNSIAVLTVAAAEDLVLTGSSALEITAFTSSAAITEIDTTGMTGAFVMGAATANTSATLFDGGAGNDTFIGNSGADTLKAGGGTNSLTGGVGADKYVLGSGVDTIVEAIDGGVDASATSLTATIAADDTLTFGDGVQIVENFTAGAGGDVLDLQDTAVTGGLVSSLGKTATALTDHKVHYLSGEYVESTGVFTIKANGTGSDTIIFAVDDSADGESNNLSTVDGILILLEVDSDDLVASENLT